MAGVILSLSIEGSRTVLSGLRTRLKNLTPAMRAIGRILEASVDENFKQGGRPAKWPLSIRVKQEGGKTLIKSSCLRMSIKSKAYPNRAEVGTNLIYGAIHQFGGRIRAKRKPYLRFKIGNTWVMTKSVVIPPRPYLMVQDGDWTEIKKALTDYLTGGFK